MISLGDALRADVAVVGGGPAGNVCSALLARMGYDIVLVDHGASRHNWPELLSPEAALALAEIGFPSESLAACGAACRGIRDTWNRKQAEFQNFQLTRCSVGWVVVREQLCTALRGFAEQQGVRTLRATGSAALLSQDESGVALCIAGFDRPLVASFLVDSTGASSNLMPAACRRRLRFDRLVAIRVRLAGPIEPRDSMLFASASAGWWYVLDLPSEGATGVFLTDGDLVPKQGIALARHLHNQLAEAFGQATCIAENGTVGAKFEICDARTTCRRQLWRGRWLPIGDAAFSVDPICGNGLNRSFEMAQAAATCVAEFLESGQSEKLQQLATLNTVAFSETLSMLREVYSLGSGNWPDHAFWLRRRNSAAYKLPM